VVWDFRSSPVGPVSLRPPDNPVPWDSPEVGYMVPPGEYRVAMYTSQGGTLTELGPPQPLSCRPLNHASLSPADRAALDAFNAKVAALSRAISAADAHRARLAERLPYLEKAILGAPTFQASWLAELSAATTRLKEIDEKLNGDPVLVRYEGQARVSLKGRTDLIISSLWNTTSGATGTYERAYQEAHDGFGEALAALQQADAGIRALEDELEQAGAPYTPGRLPVWGGD
jgi:hypothetical protein